MSELWGKTKDLSASSEFVSGILYKTDFFFLIFLPPPTLLKSAAALVEITGDFTVEFAGYWNRPILSSLSTTEKRFDFSIGNVCDLLQLAV